MHQRRDVRLNDVVATSLLGNSGYQTDIASTTQSNTHTHTHKEKVKVKVKVNLYLNTVKSIRNLKKKLKIT